MKKMIYYHYFLYDPIHISIFILNCEHHILKNVKIDMNYSFGTLNKIA